MKKRYPPDKKLTLECDNPNCPVGVTTYTVTLEQTQAQVPSPYEGRRDQMDRWTIIRFQCSKCGCGFSVGMGLAKGCGWDKRLKKEGVRRKDPKQRKID